MAFVAKRQYQGSSSHVTAVFNRKYYHWSLMNENMLFWILQPCQQHEILLQRVAFHTQMAHNTIHSVFQYCYIDEIICNAAYDIHMWEKCHAKKKEKELLQFWFRVERFCLRHWLSNNCNLKVSNYVHMLWRVSTNGHLVSTRKPVASITIFVNWWLRKCWFEFLDIDCKKKCLCQWLHAIPRWLQASTAPWDSGHVHMYTFMSRVT